MSTCFYIYLFKQIFIYLSIFGMLSLCCCPRAFTRAASGGSSLLVELGLLIAMVSLIAEHGLQIHSLQ